MLSMQGHSNLVARVIIIDYRLDYNGVRVTRCLILYCS